MPQTLRVRVLSIRLALGGAVAMPLAAIACARGALPPVVVRPPASASVTAVHAPAAPVPPPAPPATATATAAPLPPVPAPTSRVAVAARSDPSWASCLPTSESPGNDVASEVSAMARGCAAATHMKLQGTTLTGKQGAEDPPQSFPLEAKANHCYRVYARAADTVQDLDVVVQDSASTPVGGDSTEDGSPVVLVDGEVCFRRDDKASVVVSVGAGKGRYALQIWSN